MLVGIWLAGVAALPLISTMLMSWTAAILLLRLRPVRPHRRRLWCQPGFLACVATVLVFTWSSVEIGVLNWVS